ncbi:MAG: hypothetical protein IIW48_09870 [Clostridia bacterium]|nr:hypothetical protein [Clostridia bacterium]
MAYQRALWHSGLTYQQTCSGCQALVRYTDASLDYRPWFADGFVYCPRCRKPLRHNERYAIDQDGNYINPQPAPAPQPGYQQPMPQSACEGGTMFCCKCGKQFAADDNFCSGCGTKRE